MWRTLRQLLGGLQHVHSHGITHRDLKPKNIFVDFGDAIKLGDFGLATGEMADKPPPNLGVAGKAPDAPESRDADAPADAPDAPDAVARESLSGAAARRASLDPRAVTEAELSSHTADVGTYMYMDPRWHGRHSFAFDLYALGVILFELCSYFPTGMERVVALADLRRGQLPHGFGDTWPEQTKLIKWMMHPDPSRRPTAQVARTPRPLHIRYAPPRR